MKSALCCYAWDFAAEGVEPLLGQLAGAGFSHLIYAVTYHTGWFLHARRHPKAFMPPSGAHYFAPQSALYGKLQPLVAPECIARDWTREVGAALGRHGLQMIAWTVGAHNFRQGALHPDCASRNAFGDVYPHALCPADPDVRHYLLALARDVGTNLPVEALALEAFDYQGWKHDHQHERDFYNLGPLEGRLMNLCFHPATQARVGAAGVDGARVQSQVVALLQARFDASPERPPGYPDSLDELHARIEGLAGYEAAMVEVVEEITREAVAAMRPAMWHSFGGPKAADVSLAGRFSLFAYGQDADYVRAAYPAAKAKAGERELWVMLKMGAQEMPSRAFVEELIGAVREVKADGLAFYNYSEAPPRVFQWVCEAMQR